MICGDFSLMRNWPARMLAFAAVLLCGTSSHPSMAAPQGGAEVPPDATPQIQQVDPSQAAPGAHLTVIIQGSNFSSAATVSAVSTAIHVDSSKWISATHLEAELSVGASAQPSTVSLMVSNPASHAAEAAFTIVAGQAPPSPATPPTPDAPTSPPAPPNPAPQVNPPAPPAPIAPATPIGPQVTTVEPAQVAPGFNLDLKVTGKNFALGAKVSFANPGVRVLKTTTLSDTELSVHIKVTFDATPGVASLFVVNPDDSEVEIPFEVVAKGAVKPPPPLAPVSPAAPASPVAPGSPDAQRYSAFHLGSPAEAFQVHGKVKGALVVSAGTIQYQEDGKTLVNIAVGDVKEIKTSAVATSTFHITLSSGKVYHFAPGSLRPSDARSLVDSLRAALPPASK